MTREAIRTCIITGANAGIGKCAARQIAGKGLRIILACRNIAQAEAAAAEIQSHTGNNKVFARRVDLSLMSDVQRFAKAYIDEFGMLDVRVNNAADFDLSRKQPLITPEGNEAQFATNLLAPFVLTQTLMPLLAQSGDGRVISIGTQGLVVYPNITFDFENIRGNKAYSPAKTYYETKLGLLMLSLALRDRTQDANPSVFAVRVTNVKIDMARYPDISPLLKALYRVKRRFSISPDEMAKVYTALATEEKRQGFYYDEKLREVRCNKAAYDEEAQQRLWHLCEELVQAACNQ